MRFELDKRDIDLDSMLCPCCDSSVESVDHCMVLCEYAQRVWELIFAWWGMGPVDRFTTCEMLKHRGGSVVNSESKDLWKRFYGLPDIIFGKIGMPRFLKISVTRL